MGPGSKLSQISSVMVDDSFAAQDDQFVDQVRRIAAARYLAALADRWKKDPRPGARRQIFEYLALSMDRPGHHAVVKRFFKQAEASDDHELMAAFVVAFDRLVRRQRRMRFRFNPQTRQSSDEEVLIAPRDQILAAATDRKARNPHTGERLNISGRLRIPKHGRYRQPGCPSSRRLLTSPARWGSLFLACVRWRSIRMRRRRFTTFGLLCRRERVVFGTFRLRTANWPRPSVNLSKHSPGAADASGCSRFRSRPIDPIECIAARRAAHPGERRPQRLFSNDHLSSRPRRF